LQRGPARQYKHDKNDASKVHHEHTWSPDFQTIIRMAN
jgi:hypothetical protein